MTATATPQHHDPLATDTVIETERLTRRFGDLVAVHEASLSIPQGEVFGFLGHNGAGKTTTLRLMNGMLLPTSGTVRVFGMDPCLDGKRVRRRTGVLTASPALDPQLTPRENLRTYGDIYGVPIEELPRRLDEVLATFEITDIADEQVRGLSTGMKQRVALARALVHDPDVLFLDEPTSAIDPMAARAVRALVRDLARERGRTIVICTHNLAEAQQVCDRVAIIHEGSIVALGSPGDLARQLAQGRYRLTVRLDEQIDRSALERALDIFTSVEVHDTSDRTAIITYSDPSVIPDVVAAIVQQGFRLREVSEAVPTLEDVYVNLHTTLASPPA